MTRSILFVLWSLLALVTHSTTGHVTPEEGDMQFDVVGGPHEGEHSHRIEFTFRLPSNTRQCFVEEFHQEFLNYTFQYSLQKGDSLRVWLEEAAKNLNIYDQVLAKRDTFTFLTAPGLFRFCFENPSYLSRRANIVYFRLETTAPPSLIAKGVNGSRPGPHGPSETISDTIYSHLAATREFQREYRLRQQSGRGFALDLNERIGFLAPLSTIGMLFVCAAQVVILKKILAPRSERSALDSYLVDLADKMFWQ